VAESTRDQKPEPDHQRLRPDQAPVPSADELSAISAVMNARADQQQQARFVGYFLRMSGVHAGESMMRTEWWGFAAGKRWMASTLLEMAEIRLVPLGVRKALEKETDG
jgi:hypothetical protein